MSSPLKSEVKIIIVGLVLLFLAFLGAITFINLRPQSIVVGLVPNNLASIDTLGDFILYNDELYILVRPLQKIFHLQDQNLIEVFSTEYPLLDASVDSQLIHVVEQLLDSKNVRSFNISTRKYVGQNTSLNFLEMATLSNNLPVSIVGDVLILNHNIRFSIDNLAAEIKLFQSALEEEVSSESKEVLNKFLFSYEYTTHGTCFDIEFSSTPEPAFKIKGLDCFSENINISIDLPTDFLDGYRKEESDDWSPWSIQIFDLVGSNILLKSTTINADTQEKMVVCFLYNSTQWSELNNCSRVVDMLIYNDSIFFLLLDSDNILSIEQQQIP